MTVTVEGEEVGLRELVESMTQFVTCDDLHEKTVLFPDEETAEDIRMWVGNSGSFVGASGARLKRKLNTRVRGRPIHSHVAERMVNLGNNVTRKYAAHESEDRISGKVAAVANGTQVDLRAAAYEYEEAHKEEVAMQARLNMSPVSWRDMQTGQKRRARPPGRRWRNKEVNGRTLVRAAKRAERITEEVAAEARSKAEARGGVKARTGKRKEELCSQLKDNVEKRAAKSCMRKINAATRDAHSATSNPPRLNIGMIDLTKPPLKEVLAEECELRGIFVSEKRTELVPFLVKKLRDYHEGADLITKMTPFEAGSKVASWVGDRSASGGGGGGGVSSSSSVQSTAAAPFSSSSPSSFSELCVRLPTLPGASRAAEEPPN